jgi:hypothetical protein
MKKYSVFLVVALAGLLVFLLWPPRHPLISPVPGPNNQRPITERQQVAGDRGTQERVPTIRSSEQPEVTGSNPPGRMSKDQEMVEILSTQNDVPIVFYGRLEDQFGKPVVGADVTGSTIIYGGLRVGSDKVSTKSDATGSFSLEAGKGESMGVMPRKAGYALASTNTAFRYSHLSPGYHVPDPGNPVVLKMWKLQGSEPLLGINGQYKMPFTDAPIHFDLIKGEIVPIGGDIKLTVNRSPGVVSERTLQDWSVQVEAVDGGLIEPSGQDRVTYWAPDAGYQPSATYVFSTNAPYRWVGGFNHGFFLRTRNGQVYSKLGLSFRINQQPEQPMYITLSGVANTNRSRNWEGDPNTMKPK